MKKKREKESNQSNRGDQKSQRLQPKKVEVEVNIVKQKLHKKIKDFKVCYQDPAKREVNKNIAKEYEEIAEKELMNEEVTVSKVVRFNAQLEELGMTFVLDEEIRKVIKAEKPYLFDLYREAFVNFDKNEVMRSWVNPCPLSVVWSISIQNTVC
jgi:hypothetical protein